MKEVRQWSFITVKDTISSWVSFYLQKLSLKKICCTKVRLPALILLTDTQIISYEFQFVHCVTVIFRTSYCIVLQHHQCLFLVHHQMHKWYFHHHFIQIIILWYGAHSLFLVDTFYATIANVCPMSSTIAYVGAAQQWTWVTHA